MDHLWSFLGKERNRQVLAWLGGGLVVVIAGLWTVFVYLHPAKSGGSGGVSASSGSIATGGNITGSTVTVGGTPPK